MIFKSTFFWLSMGVDKIWLLIADGVECISHNK